MKLLEGVTANSNGTWFEVPLPGNTDKSHVRTLFLQGVVDTATVTIEGSQVSPTESNLPGPPVPAPTARQTSTITTMTALGVVNISARMRQIRAVVSSVGASTDLDLTVV